MVLDESRDSIGVDYIGVSFESDLHSKRAASFGIDRRTD
jgi:hypothetical protein